MIANISTILYVLSVSDEIITSGTLQRGTAISRVDEDDGFQIYKYSNYLNSMSNTDSDSNEGIEITRLEEEKIYLITGKFSVLEDNSINIVIISNVHISLDREDIPVMKPTVHLLGKTMDQAQLTEAGYSLQVQVKPYLSKENFNTFLVNLTHPVNGRLRNALTKAKKNSTIHATGLFFIAKKQLFCEILEFQFVAAKIETESTVTVPWKSKMDSGASSSKTKSSIERRIDLIRGNLETKPPTTPSLANTSKQGRKRREPFTAKISNISKSLLSEDNQDNRIEISDSDEEAVDDEDIEDDGGNVDSEKDDPPADIPNVRRSKRKKTN
jgi:hypothetical protein